MGNIIPIQVQDQIASAIEGLPSDPQCPPIGPLLVKSDCVSEAPQLGQVPGSVESHVPVAAAAVSSLAGPCRPPSSMQISMAQSMGTQQGALPHLTHHTNPIFNSPPASGQSEPSPPAPGAPPGLPSIANAVSEFSSQLESRPEVGLNHAGLDLESWSRGETDQTKSPRFHPYSHHTTTSAMTHSNNSQTFSAYQAPFSDGLAYQGSHGYLETFNTEPSHDQSSKEIWDMDSHTVKRYNPGPDPVSPGPIPTTPTMYGSGVPPTHSVQQLQSKVLWDKSSTMYSPYDVMGRNPPPGMPPLSVSPGLDGPWTGSMNLKTHGVADSKRPKSYQCEACDKWFTSSGHLKRHYNTTLHKNAMKQKGDGYIELNGGSLSIPSVESRGAHSPCMSVGHRGFKEKIYPVLKLKQDFEEKSIIEKKNIMIPSTQNNLKVDETSIHLKPKHDGVTYTHIYEYCTQCDFKSESKSSLHQHVKSIHKGVTYNCTQCDYEATRKSSLRQHVKSVHEGVRYNCKQCDHKATQKSHLDRHVKSVHEGVRYNCTQCDYKATQNENLHQHIDSVHEGVIYNCTQCYYTGNGKKNLRRHIAFCHEGRTLTKYNCDQCDFTGNSKFKLSEHVVSKHVYALHPCSQCAYKAKTKAKLQSHVKKHH